MGKHSQRVVGIVPAKIHSTRFPNKNFYEYDGKPLWQHAYDNLSEHCDDVYLSSDKQITNVSNIYRPHNAAHPDASILDVMRFAYMSLDQPYEIIVTQFANTIGFQPDDILQAIDLLINQSFQEVRGYHYDGCENGLIAIRTERLFNPPGLSSYMGAVVCNGQEIHYQEELDQWEK